jgi:exopolysaccharide biosynthesis polyprenyl glycosylphosphotransferase
MSSSNLQSQLSRVDGLFAFAMALASTIYGNTSRVPTEQLRRFLEMRITVLNASFAALFMVAWTACFRSLGIYQTDSKGVLRDLSRIGLGSGLMTGVLAIYLRASGTTGPTGRIALCFLLCSSTYQMCRILSRRWIVNRNPKLVIILGSGRRAAKAWRELRTRFHKTVNLVGFVDDRSVSEMAPDIGNRYLGMIGDLNDLLLRNVVDELLIALPAKSCYDAAQRAIGIAEQVGVRTVYMQDMYVSKVRYNTFSDSELFNDLVPYHEDYVARQEVKRLLDVVGALIGLTLLSPVFLLIAVAIKITSKGPVFFTQQRYGYRRRLFRMLKFRSMVNNAPQLMEKLESANEATGPIFKIRNDPRITRVGRFLRATSLDELPQLWNVLIGNMSLVGPRPMSVRDVSLFNEATLMRRFTVKPGITGLWQISERNAFSFDKWIELDFNYIDSWSLALDLEILVRTLPVVLRRTGAV